VVGGRSSVVGSVWQVDCSGTGVVARTVEELLVYQKALAGGKAVSALLNCAGLREDFRLRRQLADASDSTSSNIAEGFSQQSDRRFAQFLYYAKGSANEVRTRLGIARERRYITADEFTEAEALFASVGKMTTRLIQYLERSNRPRRGLSSNDEARRGQQ
jgi:four helix bundle protein